jgi:hypothetical protein
MESLNVPRADELDVLDKVIALHDYFHPPKKKEEKPPNADSRFYRPPK